MDLEKRLSRLGFEEKEVKVYLAALKLGTNTVTEIAKKSGIKRPTCYVVLESLVEKGFVSTRQTKKHMLYSPAHPKKILTDAREKEKKAQEVLPDLLAMYKDNAGKPSVQMFEGVEGMRQTYADVIDYMRKGKEVLVYGKFQYVEDYPEFEQNMNDWLKALENKGNKAREIIYKDEEYERDYIERSMRANNPNREIRIFAKSDNIVAFDNVIYGDKLVLFAGGEAMFALVIESVDVANSYRAMFEYAWQLAEEI